MFVLASLMNKLCFNGSTNITESCLINSPSQCNEHLRLKLTVKARARVRVTDGVRTFPSQVTASLSHVGMSVRLGQVSPKCDKSGTFSDQISVHFGSESQNVLKYDLKNSCVTLSNFGPI